MDRLFVFAGALLAVPIAWTAVFVAGSWLTSEAAEPVAQLECGLRLDEQGGERTGLIPSVRVAMALDEEWQAAAPGAAANGARRLLSASSSVFHGVGIHFLPVQIVTWESPDEVTAAPDLLGRAQHAVPRRGADIVVALTGQSLIGDDGYADVGGRYVLVGHHPDRPGLDALVLAHEISHLFGAHHGCDVETVGGMMSDAGFEDLHVMCPCTRRVLRWNAHRFHLEQ